MLKAGELPCLVATSSLELGIDMGAVDLVLQVESPKSVTAGLQRIGRAGHNVGDTSKGRIFPKFRADLLECAVVAQRMREGKIETTVVPRNPLDVLAQQIVAMAASAEDEVAAASTCSRRCWPAPTRTPSSRARSSRTCSTCSTAATRREEFGELRPRIVWDRVAGTIRARKGSRALAITNAGTIPDRGLFSVNLPDGRRVGELDEEMVYEARAGPGVPARRVVVADRGDHARPRDRHARAGRPGRGAVLEGRRRSGRPRELGEAIGAFARWAVDQDADDARGGLRPRPEGGRRTCSSSCASSRRRRGSSRATARSSSSASATRSATGACASSRPFGGRVHAAWGLAL